jgi:hypothetical protein
MGGLGLMGLITSLMRMMYLPTANLQTKERTTFNSLLLCR